MSDPYFANVSLLLHCDGTNGSTTFTDSSTYAHTMTPAGVAQISTANPKFGSGGYIPGGGFNNNISTPNSVGSELDLATGDFTVEGFVTFASANAFNQLVIGSGVNGVSGWFTIFTPGTQRLSAHIVIGGTDFVVSTVFVSFDVYHHFALVRNGSNFDFYLDAVGSPGPLTNAGSMGAPPAGFYIGFHPGIGSVSVDYLDEIRVTKGVARYTAAGFTIPTAAFPDTGPPPPIAGAFGGFVDTDVYGLIQLGHVGSIKPRIYSPRTNQTTRTRS